MMFSYGSGCAASMFVLNFTSEYKKIASVTSQYKYNLAQRIKVTAQDYDAIMAALDKSGIKEAVDRNQMLHGVWRDSLSELDNQREHLIEANNKIFKSIRSRRANGIRFRIKGCIPI